MLNKLKSENRENLLKVEKYKELKNFLDLIIPGKKIKKIIYNKNILEEIEKKDKLESNNLKKYSEKSENIFNEDEEKTYFESPVEFLERSNKIEEKNLELIIYNQELSHNLQEIKKKQDIMFLEKNREIDILIMNKTLLEKKIVNEKKMFLNLKLSNKKNRRKNIDLEKFQKISKIILDLYLYFKNDIKKNYFSFIIEKNPELTSDIVIKILEEIEKHLFSFIESIKNIDSVFIIKIKNKLEYERRKLLMDKNLKIFENKKLEMMKMVKFRNNKRKKHLTRKYMFRQYDLKNEKIHRKASREEFEESEKRFFE